MYFIQRKKENSVEYIELLNTSANISIKIAPSIGNLIFSLTKNKKEYLWVPEPLERVRSDRFLCGIPFLAPWANRLENNTYFINNKPYQLNSHLQLRRDRNNKPIHGLLLFSPHWKIINSEITNRFASITSELHFWRHPEYMSHFPFAHNIIITIILVGNKLEVRTEIENLTDENLPVSVGFHPYFQLPRVPYDEWFLELPRCQHRLLDHQLLPTKEVEVNPFTSPIPLNTTILDNVFEDLDKNKDIILKGGEEELRVTLGPKFNVAIIYAPSRREFVCIEPMTAITNAINLASRGDYSALQFISPGNTWEESFWISI